jgi:hypothetical protein
MNNIHVTSVSQHCLSLNNAGIDLLGKGAVDEALSSLVNALVAAKELLRFFGQEDATSCDILQTPGKIRPSFTVDLEKALSNDSDPIALQCNMYRSAFLLCDSWFVSLNYSRMLTICIAIVFNLGLTHHFRAIKSRDMSKRDERLHQALHLYELAHTMQREGDTHLSLEFFGAIACNLGNIHRWRGDESRSKKCFQHLHMLVIFSQQCEEDCEKMSLDATDTFMSCVCYLMMRAPTAPAA